MITVDFKGIIKYDIATNEWCAQDKNGIVIDADFLTAIDDYLEFLDYDPTEEGEEVEIIIKVSRKDDKNNGSN